MNIFKRFSCAILSLICILNLSFYPNYIFSQEKNNFKVVAYCSDIFKDSVETNIQYDKLTHIIYAFLIPKEDGSLVPIKKPDELKKLVKKGHENNVKVLIAVGGWFDEAYTPLDNRFEKIAASDELRESLVNNIVKFVDEYNLDGVEIDWEYPDLGQSSLNYEKLVLELSSKLKEKNKYLTAALNGAWSKEEGPAVSKSVTTKCLESFDWISIMAYDMNNKQHSPFWFADTSIEYWLNRDVPKEKIVIGIPFYAHPTNPTWKVYRDIVKQDKENAYKDAATIDSIKYYYNGINTVKEKTRLALNKASGVMLFDVNEDTLDDLSLVKSIDDVINETAKLTLDEKSKKVYFVVDNHELIFNENDNLGIPFIDKNNRTLVPVRKALESIGVDISYNSLDKVVYATKGNTDLRIPINKDYIHLNGQKIQMDTKAIIKGNRTYIPLRYVFESFNYKTTWHNSSRTIIVTPQS
ncbi:MAG: glycosyl hydrolase family 18 protein [Tepidibacter sp.]|jgi:GH18 family chitinase|uniref:glycosyl hydrolase family 18 protein n=1 Tax=Tepidibacter sp. TaxID=2529387 RepID=UPI0025FED4DF|nr:glycosyl hydrolase family 18 protein [Tepidibacter sp.]MCT4509655.1 glycosyl hydrolase family 18 protein [Tepidibacter sp.]